MRRWILGLLFLVAACQRAPRYVLVVDDLALDGATPQGTPWCADGSAPDVYVLVDAAGGEARTATVTSSWKPRWHEPVVTGSVADYRNGILVEVMSACGGDATLAGSVTFHPPASAIRGGGLTVGPFGGVHALDLHFVAGSLPAGYARAGGTWVDDGSWAYGGAYDDSYDDTTWDDSGADDTWDDGTGDPGTSDPGTGDPGSNGSDGSDGTSRHRPRPTPTPHTLPR